MTVLAESFFPRSNPSFSGTAKNISTILEAVFGLCGPFPRFEGFFERKTLQSDDSLTSSH